MKIPTLPRRPAEIRGLLVWVLLAVASIASGQAIVAAGPCVADSHTLCLNDNRFSVTADFQETPSGPSAPATAVPLTADTGYFWFFDPNNVELVTKVLNGCVPYEAYWFFASGLTNVGVHIVVTDLDTGDARTYDNPVGTPFAPIQDTSAFHTCP
jgi:hypothetical protein